MKARSDDPHLKSQLTWEAEAGESEFKASPGKVTKTLSQKQLQGQVPVAHTCKPNYSGGLQLEASPGK
jgi:hypothetical protein